MFSQKYHKIGKPKKELTETKKCRRNLIQTQKQLLKPNHTDIEVDWFSLLRNMQTISQSSHGNEHSSSELQRLGSQTMGTGSQALGPVLTFCFLCISLFPLDSRLFSSTFCELFSLAQKFSDKEIFCYVLFLCLRQRVPHTLFKGFAVAVRTVQLNPTWNLVCAQINLTVVIHLTASVYTTITNGHDLSLDLMFRFVQNNKIWSIKTTNRQEGMILME